MPFCLRSCFPLLLLLSVPVLAGETPASDACLECHEDPALQRTDGRAMHLDVTALKASVHGQAELECVDCHADLKTAARFPHPVVLARVDCAACHKAQAALYERGVHAKARAGGSGDAATCADCHGDHDVRPPKDPESKVNHFRLPGTCGRCHGDEKLMLRNHIQVGDTFHAYDDSIHGVALRKKGLTVAPNCSDCHRPHDVLPRSDPESPVNRLRVPATCGRCHEGIVREYQGGIHGQALAAGNEKAPACTGCHTAHNIRSVEGSSWRLQVLAECGDCHLDKIASYRDTFHGQVTKLGFARSATCSDCHGAHAVYPNADPRSSVAGANRVATCQKCHPGTNANFARYDPHVEPENAERNQLIFLARRFMKGLLWFVFAFFGVHTTLWLGREVLERRRLLAAKEVSR